MRTLLAAVAILAVAATPAFANKGSDKMKACAATWSGETPDQKKGISYQDFTKSCMKGEVAPTPAPSGSTGVCKDGTYTDAKVHKGACSHHGGVAKWL
jgi:hypothetical protein